MLLLLACVGSSDVPTDTIRIEARAEDDGDTTWVYAPLSRGGSTLTIEEGDTLCAVAQDTREQCRTRGSTGLVLGSFTLGEISPVRVELRRTAHESALETTMELPEGFDLTATVQEGGDVLVTWSPTSTDPMRYAIEADCLDDLEGDLADEGTWTIPAADLTVEAACDVRIQVERYRAGTPDPLLTPDSTAEGVAGRVAWVTVGG